MADDLMSSGPVLTNHNPEAPQGGLAPADYGGEPSTRVDTSGLEPADYGDGPVEPEGGYDPSVIKPEPDFPPEPEYFDEPGAAPGPDETGDATNPPGEPSAPKKGDETQTPQPLSRDDWAAVGLTEEQARKLDGADALDDTINLIVRRTAALGEAALEAERGQGAVQPPPAQEQQQLLPETPPAPQAPPPEKLFELQTDARDLPELHSDLSNFQQAMAAQIAKTKAIESRLETAVGYIEAQQLQEQIRTCDRFFASQPEAVQKFTGSLPGAKLLANSPELKLRNSIIGMAVGYTHQVARQGEAVDLETALGLAKGAIMADKLHAIAREEVRNEHRESQSQFTARPTHREPAPLPPDVRAGDEADAIYRRRGLLKD